MGAKLSASVNIILHRTASWDVCVRVGRSGGHTLISLFVYLCEQDGTGYFSL